MLWIFGGLAILGVAFLILNRFFEGMNMVIWFANFFSWAILISVFFVWIIHIGASSRDFGYMEGCLLAADEEMAMSNPRFIELYLQYELERKFWSNRQFHASLPPLLAELFDKEHRITLQKGE